MEASGWTPVQAISSPSYGTTTPHMPAAVTHFTPKKRRMFLAALAACGNVTRAAQAACCTREGAYHLRTQDADFAAAWDDALEQAADVLEQEAFRRAHDGVEEPLTCARGLIYDETTGQPVTVRKYSDTLLIFLLKGARPQKYRDNVNVTAQATTLGITVVLEQMSRDSSVADAAAAFVGRLESPRQAEG